MEYKPAGLLVVMFGKTLSGIPHLGVLDRWLATFKRARIFFNLFACYCEPLLYAEGTSAYPYNALGLVQIRIYDFGSVIIATL